MADSSTPLTLTEWHRKFTAKHTPTPPEAGQTSKRSCSRQLDPDEQLSLVKLALEYADILRCEHDARAHETAVTLAFKEQHGWGLKSVRSELFDLEKKWRSDIATGFSYDLSVAIMEWSEIVDLERARKAEELAERRIEREMLGWDRDAVASQHDQPLELPKVVTFTLKRVYIVGMIIAYAWMIIHFCSRNVDTEPT
jgi:hypothetical protein